MRFPLAFVLALTAMPAFAGPASDAVKFFYADPGAEFEPANRDRFTDPAKSVLDANEKAEDKAELCIDFVLSINAQDYEQSEIDKTLKLNEEIFGEDATVTAYFTLFPGQADSEEIVIWTLKNVGGEWKVADLMSDGSNWVLSEFKCQ